MTPHRFADLAELIAAAPARLGGVRFVAVDGPAGSGKTTFAGRLAPTMAGLGLAVQLIHVDDLLDGWDDLPGYWPRFAADVLAPLRAGRPGSYHRYDWYQGRFAERVPVPVPDVLVLEGVGSARREGHPDLTLGVFVSVPRELRLRRGIERDGESMREHWLRWMAGEDAHFGADRTEDRAGLLVDGTAEGLRDPDRQYTGRFTSAARLGDDPVTTRRGEATR
jgi:hypothetical protein